ncbi:MAG TPA: trigger factor [Candidatus Saccharimonadales bacterium]|nr:trigger factor [Candidatus Saccharimonadales bacterium]
MNLNRETLTSTKVKLTVAADQDELDRVKEHVLKELSSSVKVQGFRAGKAPAALLEKQIDPARLQTEFLDHAINDLYAPAVQELKLRPVAQPQINVTKFVPFTTLEFTAEVEVVGDIKLANYKTIKLTPTKAEVTAADVNKIIENLQERGATKTSVNRAAKNGDEVLIDFSGSDAKTKDPIAGADGKDYPLTLGSNSFIPGFEDELVGLKAGETKTFDIVFPADYGAKELQSRKVTFAVTVHDVKELAKAKLDDEFAKSVGPFKTVAELKADVKKQLTAERQREAQNQFDNELLQKIADKSEVELPASLVEEEIDRIENEEKQQLVYQGQTWQEHLDAEKVTAEEHREQKREGAERNLKVGLVLGEVADKEGITVTPEELEIRIMLLKNQYEDDAMHAELEKPENRRDIANRMMTEKTLDKLRGYATKAKA